MLFVCLRAYCIAFLSLLPTQSDPTGQRGGASSSRHLHTWVKALGGEDVSLGLSAI